MDKKNINFFYRECLRGNSLLRSFQNLEIQKQVKINGKSLDLGAKSDEQSYNEYITKDVNLEMTYTDFFNKGKNLLSFDLNYKFPIDDESYQNILIFNVLEHIYDTRNVLNESYRVLKKDGVLYGSVPFLFRHHNDPSDYWRFTDDAMLKLLKEAGFKNIKIKRQGIGIFNLVNSFLSNYLRFKKLIFLSWRLGFFLDYIFSIRKKKSNNNIYLGIFFTCNKK